jgi:hypothetical protein
MLNPKQFAAQHGAVYEYSGSRHDVHSLHIEHETPNEEGLTRSYVEWAGSSWDPPGEFQGVSGVRKGDASRLHALARNLSRQFPSIPLPQHSDDLSPEGMAWAEKEKAKYGDGQS